MENHRRIIEVANIACEQGFKVVVSAIALKEAIRAKVNELAKCSVNWIYVDTDENTCRQRDAKGLYSAPENNSVSQFFVPSSVEKILLHLRTFSEEIEMSEIRVFSELIMVEMVVTKQSFSALCSISEQMEKWPIYQTIAIYVKINNA